jgi:hypothetical protein
VAGLIFAFPHIFRCYAEAMPPISLQLQNGLVAVEYPAGGKASERVDGLPVIAATSCMLVRCRHEIDGETELTLGAAAKVAAEGKPVRRDDREARAGV